MFAESLEFRPRFAFVGFCFNDVPIDTAPFNRSYRYESVRNYGTGLRYLLTDLQRAIRHMTDELGEQRGRPCFVAARVAGSLEMCRHIGYDIPTWIDE